MAISRKITKPTKSKKPSVEELIMKGGSSGLQSEGLEQEQDEEEVKRVQLRIPVAKLDEIDQSVKKRPGKLSRHTWIMEAIEEKLQREEDE